MNRPLDILFVLDSSGSIDNDEFYAAKNFLEMVVADALPYGTRVALMQFASIVTTKMSFGDNTKINTQADAERLKDVVSTISPIGGATFTREAMRDALTMFPQDKNGREQMMVLITDGVPTSGP